MNVEETLYFCRKNRKLKQGDIFKYIDSSVYSKIESGKRTLKFSELVDFLERLSIPLNEFSEYLEEGDNQRKYRKLFKLCAENPESKQSKKELLEYFKSLNFDENITEKDMSNYVGIKLLFSSKWKEVSFLNKEDLDIIFNKLIKKKYYFQYDYAVLSNVIFLYDSKRIEKLMKLALPVVDVEIRNNETIEFIKNMMNNLITTLLRKGKFEESLNYLRLANLTEKKGVGNLDYRLVLKYLENMTMYGKTQEKHYKEDIEDYIRILNKLGENSFADSIEKEFVTLFSDSKEIPVFIQADL